MGGAHSVLGTLKKQNETKKDIKCFFFGGRGGKNLYKNLFTYKIPKKVQVKTQCDGRAQICRVCVFPCLCVCLCVYARPMKAW